MDDNENYLFKYEGKTDLTNVANEAYQDGLKSMVKELGQAGTTVISFFNNTIGVPLQLYNTWAKSKIDHLKQKIEDKMLEIPSNKLITPPINVIGPAMEGLKYNLDEEDLKEMFSNLIANACNKDFENTIHPRFAEIIKQLSADDAILLKELSKYPDSAFAIANIQQNKEKGHVVLFPNCYCSKTLDNSKVPAIIDNLETLGILKADYSNFLVDNSLYDPILMSDTYKSLARVYPNLSLQKGILSLNILGRDFIKVCIA